MDFFQRQRPTGVELKPFDPMRSRHAILVPHSRKCLIDTARPIDARQPADLRPRIGFSLAAHRRLPLKSVTVS
jgi:hypothetical protein